MEESLESKNLEAELPLNSVMKTRGHRKKKTEPTVASLFAGIGGFDLAFERAGARISFQCELDTYCRAVLRKHWPDASIFHDIRELNAVSLPNADIWTAGFPCQDVSLARGNHGRTGLKGSHTSLFFRLMELVEVRRPQVLLLENVVGLLNSHRGADFAIILRELTSRGYAVAWRIMNARYFGTPQSRSRVFLCAWLGNHHKAVTSLYEAKIAVRPAPERHGFLAKSRHVSGAIVPHVAYCLAATSGRHTGNDWARSYISYDQRVRRPTPTESERLQGFPTGWTEPPSDFMVPARGADSERYKAIGNAVAVPVVSWIAQRILEKIGDTSGDRLSLSLDVRLAAPDLAQEGREIRLSQMLADLDKGNFQYRWKSGGCAWGDTVIEGSVSPAPTQQFKSFFVDFLDSDVPDDRYFLSPNAATGIIRRADTVGRTLFAPFRQALESMISNMGAESAKPKGDTSAKPSIRKVRSLKR